MTRVTLGAGLIVLTAWALWARDVAGHESLITTVRFDREIVSILNRRCVMCHGQDSLAFPLESYEQTWLRRRALRTSALARHMPPWAAMPGYGQFVNENSLTLRETQFLVSWVEGMGPRSARSVFLNVAGAGTGPREEVRAALPPSDAWSLGQPALTRTLTARTIAPGETTVARTVVDLGIERAESLRALEYRPGDRRVLRAAFFTIEKTGQWVGSWTPWYGSTTLPAGVAYRLPAGTRLVAELHYTGTTVPVVDRGTLGLFFAGEAAPKAAADVVIEASGQVPPSAKAYRFRATSNLPAGAAVLALRPEVMRGITSIEVSGRRPDGGTDVLLFAKDIPMDWPTPYIFKTPVVVPRGTQMLVTAYYDNSTQAPQPGGFRLTASLYQP